VAAIAAWLATFIGFMVLTNPGMIERVVILSESGNRFGLAAFAGLWLLSVAALLLAAFCPIRAARATWAVAIALSSAIGVAFYEVSKTDFSIYDAVSLWSARHEAGRALEFYREGAVLAVFASLAGFALFMLAPSARPPRRRWLARLAAVAPLVPILLFAAVLYARDGQGSRGLPTQLSPISIGLLAGGKIATNAMPERGAVAWTPQQARVRKVLLLIDESVRADFIDWRPGNPHTPALAALRDRFVDFGPAASGANCSSYSNAILRFGASRHDLMRSLLTNATIWQYAKAAGFNTVFVDAQAAFIKKYGDKLQNFMTAAELKDIDSFNALESTVAPYDLDDRLADVIVEKLRSPEPVFVYAIKNGAHFPYDQGYPPQAADLRPTMHESSSDAARVNSYRNVIKWSVDRVMARLMAQIDLKDTVVIYTSDHGQNLTGQRLTHCTVDNPDPREALVPLLVATGNDGLRRALGEAARESVGHASHFAIVPTVLRLFGYPAADVTAKYGPSLLEKSNEAVAFTSGDIFGLFSSEVRWNAIDLSKPYRDTGESGPQHSAVATEGKLR
jgi:glucan phosphoethanolaminetransferase (alkaline phosphatase superfamily)